MKMCGIINRIKIKVHILLRIKDTLDNVEV